MSNTVTALNNSKLHLVIYTHHTISESIQLKILTLNQNNPPILKVAVEQALLFLPVTATQWKIIL